MKVSIIKPKFIRRRRWHVPAAGFGRHRSAAEPPASPVAHLFGDFHFSQPLAYRGLGDLLATLSAACDDLSGSDAMTARFGQKFANKGWHSTVRGSLPPRRGAYSCTTSCNGTVASFGALAATDMMCLTAASHPRWNASLSICS